MLKEKPNKSDKSESDEKKNIQIKVGWMGKMFTLVTRTNKPIYKGMRKFGEKMGVDVKLLMFKHRGQELTGCELASKLEGEEILVMRI